MAMFEMQGDRLYSYLSEYDSRKHNLNAMCSARPLNHVDNTTQIGFHRGGNMLPSPANQPFASKEIVKQIILQHEATFREQVHHLHHLYGKQRELMDEIRKNGNKHHLRLEMLQSNPFLSENSDHYAPETSLISSLPWLHHAQNEPDIPAAKNSLSNTSFYEKTGLGRSTNEQTGGSVRGCELTKSTLKKIGKKVLDLELPAYEYIDSEEEECHVAPAVPGYDLNIAYDFSQEIEVEPLLKKNAHTVDMLRVDNTAQASSSWRAKPLVDLNEPIVLDDLEEEEEADIKSVSLARHNDLSCSATSGKTSSQCKAPSVEQMIENSCIEEDIEDGLNVLNASTENQEQCTTIDEHEAGKNSLSCLPECCSDLTETFVTSVRGAKVEQIPETTASHLVDQDSEKLPSYGENFDLESLGSNCSTNSYPEGGANCKDMSNPPVSLADRNNCESSCYKRDSVGTGTIIQALPCADSPMLLSRKFRNAGSAGDKSPWGKRVKCGSRTCCESNCSCVCANDGEFISEMSGTKECLKDSKRNKKVSDTKDAKLVPNAESVPKSGRSSVLVAKKHVHKLSGSGFTSDLNSCINEIGCYGTPSPSTEVDKRALGNPNVKDNSRRTGELNKIQSERDVTSSSDISGSSLDELVRTAAESIVTISSSRVQNCVETPQLKHSETWKSGCLNWFAGIVASAIDGRTSEFGVALSCKNANYMDEQHHKELDFFEEMTLNLEETKELDYCFMPIFQPEEVTPETSMASQPRRGRTKRGRQQRKNFQNEVLPSLASLSRHEVTKDLQAIGGLIETTRTRRNSGLRRSSTNEWTEVTRRRRGRPSNADNADCRMSESGHGEVATIRAGWGNVTRGRRGLRRTPAIPTRSIFGQ